MEKLNVKVEHIYHSGFTVETENFFLVFDYYKGNIDLKDKRTLVFVSHGHGDHFNEEIFKWDDKKRDITYILSSDIELDFESENIHFIAPYKEISLDDVDIKTFGSTDLGVSFLVNVDNITIFHAGDLNWWHWESNTQDENLHEEKIFKEEIEKIKTGDIRQEELQRAVTNARAGVVRGLNSNMGLALNLAQAHAQHGSWTAAFSYLDDLAAVTLEDLQRVAEQYLVPRNRTVGMITNAAGTGEQ